MQRCALCCAASQVPPRPREPPGPGQNPACGVGALLGADPFLRRFGACSWVGCGRGGPMHMVRLPSAKLGGRLACCWGPLAGQLAWVPCVLGVRLLGFCVWSAVLVVVVDAPFLENTCTVSECNLTIPPCDYVLCRVVVVEEVCDIHPQHEDRESGFTWLRGPCLVAAGETGCLAPCQQY